MKSETPKEENNKENQQENPFEKNDYIINEKLLLDYHMPISLKQNEKIIEQLKNTICNINLGYKGKGTGFFKKIKFPDNEHLLPVLLTCNHIIDKSFLSEIDEIIIQINDKIKIKTIELKDRIIYTNEKIDITIIEIKEQKDGIKHFLQLDEENQDIRISGKTIYVLQYFEAYGPFHSSVPSVSYGILKDLDLDNLSFNHNCNTTFGSSGSAILNLANNKVIGIHIGASKIGNYNIGKFLNIPINDFIKKNYNNKIEENEIKSLMMHPTKKVHVEDIGINKDNYNNETESHISCEKNLNVGKIINEKKFMDEYDILYSNNIFKNI